MSIFTGEIIASGPEDGDEGKRRADAAAEAQGWTLERDPATEPREVPRIVMDPARMTGEPTIGESRFTVRTALGLIAQGYSDAQILGDYQDTVTQEGLDAARAWWASPEGMAWALGTLAELDERRLGATVRPEPIREPITATDPLDIARAAWPGEWRHVSGSVMILDLCPPILGDFEEPQVMARMWLGLWEVSVTLLRGDLHSAKGEDLAALLIDAHAKSIAALVPLLRALGADLVTDALAATE